MPLVKGKAAKSKKGFSENVRREVHAGKPVKQSVAIAYSEAKEKKQKKENKMAKKMEMSCKGAKMAPGMKKKEVKKGKKK